MLKDIRMEELKSPHGHESHVVKTFVKSRVLANTRSGMDPIRPISVFVPEEAKKDPSRRFPVLYCLAPWTSAGRSQFDWQPFKESLQDRLLRLIQSETIPPCIVVAPDLYTEFGGSQYINSSFLGNHASHIVEEVIPYIEKNFPVQPGPKHRGVFGRSSGGFGALRLAMDFSGVFSAVGCHSGDLGFEWVYRRELIELSNGLKRYDYDVNRFLDYCRTAVKLSGFETHLLMLIGMGATYSPNEASPDGFDLPLELRSGRLLNDVWNRWAEHDPLQRCETHQEGLRKLGMLYIECGNRDQYNLQYGARQFADKLKKYAISHTYLEFDDNHSGTSYRYDVSLPLLLKALI